MIKSIHIQNFRGIKEGRIEGFGPVNLFIGKNNSGKSTLLEAMFLTGECGPHGHKMQRSIISSKRNESGVFPIKAHWFKYNDDNAISIRVTTEKHDFEFYCAKDKENKYRTEAGKLSSDSNFIFLTHYGPDAQTVVFDKLHLKTLDTNDKRHRHFIEQFSQWNLSYDLVFLRDLYLFQNIFFIKKDIEKELWKSLKEKDRRDKLLTEVINNAFSLEAEYISYEPFGDDDKNIFTITTSHGTIPLDSMGDGIRFSMRLFMVTSSLENTALLVEELENFQHPSAMEKTIRAILKICEKNNVQLFTTTHNIECMKYFVQNCSDPSKLAIIDLELPPDGMLKSRMLESEDFNNLMDMKIDPRMMFLYR